MDMQTEIQENLVIRNSKLKLSDYIYFVSFSIILFIVIDKGALNISSIVFILLLGLTTYKIIKRASDKNNKIIIDKNGIYLCEKSKLMKWKNINYSYIKQHSEGIGRSSRLVDYLYIESVDGVTCIRMNDYRYDKELLRLAIEKFSGRSIGDIHEKIKDKTKNIIKGNKNINELSSIFDSFYKRQISLFLMSFFIMISISIYLQVKFEFPYVFAICFSLTLLILSLIGIIEERRFKDNIYIKNIDEKCYQSIKKEYETAYDLNLGKRQNLKVFIIFVAIIFIVFGISYMFTI